MGVSGLWSLLSPTAQAKLLETLAGNKLAVDVSIWINQFNKAMTDKDGQPIPGAPIAGCLMRVAKLMHWGIAPVFVFDGATPSMKLKTTAERRARRATAENAAQKVAAQILRKTMQLNLLKKSDAAASKSVPRKPTNSDALQELPEDFVYMDGIHRTVERSATSHKASGKESVQKRKKPREVDEFELRDVASEIDPSTADPRLITEEEMRSFIKSQKKKLDLSLIDLDDASFQVLPIERQHDIVTELKNRSRQANSGRLAKMAYAAENDPLAFSAMQIKHLMHRNKLTEKLFSLAKTPGTSDSSPKKRKESKPLRIASERAREYVLVQNPAETGYTIRSTHAGRTSTVEPPEMSEEGPIDLDSSSDHELGAVAPEASVTTGILREGANQLTGQQAEVDDRTEEQELTEDLDEDFWEPILHDLSEEQDARAQEQNVSGSLLADSRAWVTDEASVEEIEAAFALAEQESDGNRAIPMEVNDDDEENSDPMETDSSSNDSEEEEEEFEPVEMDITDEAALPFDPMAVDEIHEHVYHRPLGRPHKPRVYVSDVRDYVPEYITPAECMIMVQNGLTGEDLDEEEEPYNGEASGINAPPEPRKEPEKVPQESNPVETPTSRLYKILEKVAVSVAKATSAEQACSLWEGVVSPEFVQVYPDHERLIREVFLEWSDKKLQLELIHMDRLSGKQREGTPLALAQITWTKILDTALEWRKARNISKEETSATPQAETNPEEAKVVQKQDVAKQRMLHEHHPSPQLNGSGSESPFNLATQKARTLSRRLKVFKVIHTGDSPEDRVLTALSEDEEAADASELLFSVEEDIGDADDQGYYFVGFGPEIDESLAEEAPYEEEVVDESVVDEDPDESPSVAEPLVEEVSEKKPSGGLVSIAEPLPELSPVDKPSDHSKVTAEPFSKYPTLDKPPGEVEPVEEPLPELPPVNEPLGEVKEVQEPFVEVAPAEKVLVEQIVVQEEPGKESVVGRMHEKQQDSFPGQEDSSMALEDPSMTFSDDEEVEETPATFVLEEPDTNIDVSMELNSEREENARFFAQLTNQDSHDMAQTLENDMLSLAKEKRKHAANAIEVSTDTIKDLKTLSRICGVPFITAPMEAEAQCAFLLEKGLVDGIVSEDSDVWLFGATKLLKNIFNQQKYVEEYSIERVTEMMALDREKLVQLAYLLGSDYTPGIQGIGPTLGMEVLNLWRGPGLEPLQKFKEWWQGILIDPLAGAKEDTPAQRKLVSFCLTPSTDCEIPNAISPAKDFENEANPSIIPR
ncbi:hypothetical protein DFJ77DRAFT_149068 [Powellomyces hirtus]|nr:hypothetical protein DFJ77DRAFT_149068 [Powellomyces hirtus]